MTRITLPRQVGIITARARKAKGLTQRQLAEAAGVSRQLVNRLETGRASGIALDKLLLILCAVGCSLDVSLVDDMAADLDFGVTQAQHEVMLTTELVHEYKLDETLFDRPGEMVDDA